MALTDNSDVFGSVDEEGIHLVGHHLMRQRPSLFNYGTEMFAANPQILCRPIESHPEVLRRGNPLLTVEDPLPILGTDGLYGVNFCFQVTKLEIDFHPGNRFALPPELGELQPQRAALRGEFCAAIACPKPQDAASLGDELAGLNDEKRREGTLQPVPATDEIECFCLELFATIHSEWANLAGTRELVLRLQDLEIVDLRPAGLENSLECYLATTLRVGILPRLRFALDTMIFELGSFATLAVSPTPLSANVPNNPAIEDDQLKVFVNVGVS